MRAPLVSGGFGTITGTATTNQDGFNLIVKKHIRGTSPDFYVEKYLCAICKKDYETCPHQDPPLMPTGIHPVSVSITRNPGMGTKITDVLSVKVRGKRRHYRWVGFKEGSDSREGYIQQMHDEGQLSETARNFISSYFGNRKEGDCKYVERI
jgi:hypothetical protein